MDESNFERLATEVTEVLGGVDKTKTRDVIIVGTIGHYRPGHAASLIERLIALNPEFNIRMVDESDVVKLEDEKFLSEAVNRLIPELKPLDYMDLSPYGYNPRKSKGERKRERAYERRLWGRKNVF